MGSRIIVFSGAETLWHREPVTIHFRGDDQMADGRGCSGIRYQRGRLDGGDWTEGDSLTVPAPLDHSNDGLHVVEATAADMVGNEGPVAAFVRIDTQGPVTSAPSPVTVKRGTTAGVLPFRVDDACPSANVRIVVVAGRRRARRYMPPSTWAAVQPREPHRRSACLSAPRAATTFTVYATDLAGNPQASRVPTRCACGRRGCRDAYVRGAAP